MISFDKSVLKKLGHWLNCRYSGDLEFLNRIRLVYGKNAINYNNNVLYRAIKKIDRTNKDPRQKDPRNFRLVLLVFWSFQNIGKTNLDKLEQNPSKDP